MRNLDMRHPSSVSTLTEANRSNILETPLEPGNTAIFTVLLKSPQREGRAISYWRLKTPDGLPFGHKLWVDITVSSHKVDSKEIFSAPEPIKETEEVKKEEEDNAEQSQSTSTMIFPKLDKESPESSIHDVAKASSVVSESEANDLAEDLESLELEDE
eukprot:c37265_g1_i1 orf=64-537(+)